MKKEKLEEVYSNNINFNKKIKLISIIHIKIKVKKYFRYQKNFLIRNFDEKKLLKNLKHILMMIIFMIKIKGQKRTEIKNEWKIWKKKKRTDDIG